VTSGIGSVYYDGTDDKVSFFSSDTDISTPNGTTVIIGFKLPTANNNKVIASIGAEDLSLETRIDNVFRLVIDGKAVFSTNTYSTTAYNIAMGYAKDTTDKVTLVFNDTTFTGTVAPTSSRLDLQNEHVTFDSTPAIYISQFVLIDRLLTTTEKTELTNFVKAKSGL